MSLGELATAVVFLAFGAALGVAGTRLAQEIAWRRAEAKRERELMGGQR